MFFSNHNHALVRAVLAGVVAVAGASACSRPDRSNAGRDSVQTGAAVTPPDTGNAATQSAAVDTGMPTKDTSVSAAQAAPRSKPSSPSASTRDSLSGDHGVSGYRAMAQDTSAQPSTSSADTTQDTVAVADSTTTGKVGERIEPTEASQQANSDTAGVTDSARIRLPEDSTEVLGRVSNDTTAAVEPMARDTSTVLAQADTTAGETQPVDTTQVTPVDSSQAQADTAALSVSADTTTSQATDTMAQAEADTSTLHAQADTTTEVAMENQPDTITVVGDTSSVDKPGPRAKADTISTKGDSLAQYHDADRIRPPEDSTELHGQVNANRARVEADQAAAGAASVEPTGNMATGADAVALMTRQGEVCKVETSRDVQWDLAASPATLNPCGTGTMTLPRIQTGEK